MADIRAVPQQAASTQATQTLVLTGSGNRLTGSYGTMTAIGPDNVISLGTYVDGYVLSGATVYANQEGATGYAGESQGFKTCVVD